MTENQNPYQPPNDVDPYENWWSKLRKHFQHAPVKPPPNFAEGHAIICDGLAFFIDPDDASVLYAASPSVNTSDERMDLIVREAVRVLPIFLADYPAVLPIILGRKLIVRMIRRYQDKQAEYIRQVQLDAKVGDM
ncbi:hypothetical protein CA13_72510 [Planctomycetes bacterium CA13]|uniref:Uncharacterized protein n=1 Tax=Novipirellula herctigrandis TaxID=2527986 RepID=A0A5C5YPF5_9BACT|nr:hypothetical protein CA13_72510 [Planctomycetes bacterium CA13]